MRVSVVLAALLLAGAGTGVAAQSLKPGLWEINNRMKNNPQMDQAMAQMQQQLAAMPPEQRKQMEAMMAQRGVRMAPNAAGGMTVQMCMTPEMAQHNDVPMQDGCKLTRQQRSGKTMKVAFTCTRPPSSGEGEFTFGSPEAYSSRMTMRTTAQGRSETTEMESSGRWLAADCGNIKPAKR
jgi:hypothetical protein